MLTPNVRTTDTFLIALNITVRQVGYVIIITGDSQMLYGIDNYPLTTGVVIT
jgi:hypothetical protein